jgi:hypothetical protein
MQNSLVMYENPVLVLLSSLGRLDCPTVSSSFRFTWMEKSHASLHPVNQKTTPEVVLCFWYIGVGCLPILFTGSGHVRNGLLNEVCPEIHL